MQLLPYFANLAGSEARLVVYFLLGGTTTVFTLYLAGMGRGTFAAFIATLPVLTVFTFILIYSESGEPTVIDYARGLIVFTPAWLCYVAAVALGVERIGIFRSLGLGVAIYIVLSYILRQVLLGAKP
jgi:hypothetical protein